MLQLFDMLVGGCVVLFIVALCWAFGATKTKDAKEIDFRLFCMFFSYVGCITLALFALVVFTSPVIKLPRCEKCGAILRK